MYGPWGIYVVLSSESLAWERDSGDAGETEE